MKHSNILKTLAKVPSAILILLVYIYRYCISPLLPRGCRFSPTCSEYAITSLNNDGFLLGSLKICRRLLSCHPFSTANNNFDTVYSKNTKND